MPVISVIIPHFNRFGLLRKAISSVLIQDYGDFELIVVDDGSTESGLGELQKAYKGQVQWLLLEHEGVSNARNQGARMARGEWLCFLDSDDQWHNGKLAQQVLFHKENPEIKISQTGENWVRNGKPHKIPAKYKKQDGDLFAQSLELCSISPSTVMIKKDLFFAQGGFDERLPACEDYDLWLRVTATEKIGLVASDLMTRLGGHADQLSFKYPAMDRFRVFALFKLLNGNILTRDQKALALVNLKGKIEVLVQGAAKRDKDLKELDEALMVVKKGGFAPLKDLAELLIYSWG